MSEEPLPDADISPLRSILTEFHEIYQELRAVGFTESVATGIVAQMVSDTLFYRSDGAIISIDFEDDDDDERDDNNERGLE